MALKPAPTLDFAKVPVVGKDGNLSWSFLQWVQKIQTQVSISLTNQGINPNAPISGSASTLGALNSKTQNLTPNGLLPSSSLSGPVGPTQVGFTLDSVPDGATRFAVKNGALLLGVSFVDAAKRALIDFASVGHLNKILDNINDGVIYQRFTRVRSGQLALPTALIAAGASGVATVAVAGVLATDAIEWSFASAPAAGYASLSIIPYVTGGNVNFQIGNPSAAGVTPGAQTLNYMVIR